MAKASVVTTAIPSVLAVVLLSVGCDSMDAAGKHDPMLIKGETATRPAAKATCPEVSLSVVPDGMHISDRQLVPFSPTQLGVETEYTEPSGSRTIETVSGGYADELIESYDDLRVVGYRSINGTEATLMAGVLLDRAVHLLIWQIPHQPPPCDLRAVVATNVAAREFEHLVPAITVQSWNAGSSQPSTGGS